MKNFYLPIGGFLAVYRFPAGLRRDNLQNSPSISYVCILQEIFAGCFASAIVAA